MSVHRGIESQFWNLKEKKVPELKLKFEIVKEFDKEIYDKAEQIICWAFELDEKNAKLCGFPSEKGGEIRRNIHLLHIKINELGIPVEYMGSCYPHRPVKFLHSFSAAHFSFMLDLLKYGGRCYYSPDCITDMVQVDAEEKGLTISFEEYMKKRSN